ncbi:MAG TPA: glycosyltransferase [Thermoanaerobaculia bacterium]|nr:glycosyltransferase [Thermoanaerobaculia bacterium]
MITIVMPVKNGARHLREAIASLQPARVIVVDDASADDSAAIARDAGAEVVRNDRRLGLAANWNRCVELVATPFFVLAHQDDVYEPGFAATMLALIEAHPRAFIAHCKTTSIDDDGRATATPAARYKESLWPAHDPYEEGGDAALRRLARGNFIVAPSVVFRTEAVRAIGQFSALDFVLDWEYWLRGVLAGWTIAGTHRRLVRFRRHAATATRALERSLDRYREEIALQRWIEREAKLPAQFTTVSRIILSEIASTLANGDRARAAELLSFARAEVPGFRGTATSALANLAIASGKLGGRAMLAAQAVALRFA